LAALDTHDVLRLDSANGQRIRDERAMTATRHRIGADSWSASRKKHRSNPTMIPMDGGWRGIDSFVDAAS
jgi:hypothetical protein